MSLEPTPLDLTFHVTSINNGYLVEVVTRPTPADPLAQRGNVRPIYAEHRAGIMRAVEFVLGLAFDE